MRKNARFALLFFTALAAGCGACGGSSPPRPTPHASASAKAPLPSDAPLSASIIDAPIRAAWKEKGIEPAPLVDDAGFLRRVYLDITGVIPPLEAIEGFLADKSEDKRRRIIDELLAKSRYPEHWTRVWDRALLGKSVRKQRVDRAAFRAFLHEKLSSNTPWDRLVYELVTAEGKSGPLGEASEPDDAPGMSGPKGPGMMMEDDDAAGEDPTSHVNGAVNWLLKYQNNPQDLAGATSRIFLGVQIQCAQCHDHKTEPWKTEDFQSFAACFATTRARPSGPKPGKGKARHFEVRDVAKPPRRAPKNPEIRAILQAAPRALDGTDLSKDKSRRKALAAWITAPNNPWFARAIVNRIWAHFLGSGFVEPITDFRLSNPPLLPTLLDALARDFSEHGYDLKRLMRLIANSEVYQRASIAGSGKNELWARFRLKPLGPDELLDSIVEASQVDKAQHRKRNRKSLAEIRTRLERQMSFLFDVDEEAPERDDYEGSIPQALYLLNGPFVHESTRAIPGSALAQVVVLPGGVEARIRSVFLRVLSRPPSAAEINALKGHIDAAGNEAEGLEDLFWALFNSSEFTFNH